MRRTKLFVILMLGLVAFALAGLSGCGTMEGFGKDVQKGGEAIEDAAARNNPN